MGSDKSDSANGNEEKEQPFQLELHREKFVQYLIMGEYAKSGPYALKIVIYLV